MLKLRELLNCINWNLLERKEKGDYLITYMDGKTEKHIHMNEITKVDCFGFTTFNGSYIPLHRISTVKKGGEIVWRKSSQP